MKLPPFKLSANAAIALVSLYITLALNYAFYRRMLELLPLTGTAADAFVYSLPVAIFLILNAAFQLLVLPYLHKVIIPVLLITGALVSYNSVFLNVYFNSEMLDNVLQTNFAEGSRLLTLPYVLWVLALGVLPAWLYMRTQIRYRKWYKEIGMRLAGIAVSVLLFAAIGKGFYQDYASFFRNNKDTLHLLAPSNVIGAVIKKAKVLNAKNMPYTEQDLAASQAKPDRFRHVTVLIIGETTRAQNWGLNGYARQTTPRLAERADQVVNFHNVSSCGTATAVSLPCMFSTLDRTAFSNLKADKQDNLLDVLQRSGVNVLWLENDSGCKGVCERVPNVNVTSAWHSEEFCRNGECLDNILLKDFDEFINSTDKDTVLVLHTIGSHGPTYHERYTPEFRQFTPTCDTNNINQCSNQELVNTYDNGILYIDQFIDQVIGKLENRDDLESSVLYVSDHGESLGENGVYLHAAPYAIAPETQTKVPMVMWFSPRFRENEGVDFQCLARHAKQNAYSHDNFYSTVFGLMDMSMHDSQTYRPEKDILAACRQFPIATGKK